MNNPSSSTSFNHLNEIRKFLYGGGDPNHRNENKDTFLHFFATSQKYIETVLELLKCGANPNLKDNDSYAPLHIAVISRNSKVIDALIQNGADLNTKDKFGNSALHYFINTFWSRNQTLNVYNPQSHHQDSDMFIIWKLLERDNVDVNARNVGGYTPLLLAVNIKNLAIIKALLKNGALVNMASNRGETPLHVALSDSKPNLDIVGELLSHGACISCCDIHLQTPMDLILKRKSDPDVEDVSKELVKLATFWAENYEFCNFKEEMNVELWKLHKKCVTEIRKMRKEIIGGQTLFALVVHRIYPSNLVSTYLNAETNYTILKALTSGEYLIYSEFILNRKEIFP